MALHMPKTWRKNCHLSRSFDLRYVLLSHSSSLKRHMKKKKTVRVWACPFNPVCINVFIRGTFFPSTPFHTVKKETTVSVFYLWDVMQENKVSKLACVHKWPVGSGNDLLTVDDHKLFQDLATELPPALCAVRVAAHAAYAHVLPEEEEQGVRVVMMRKWNRESAGVRVAFPHAHREAMSADVEPLTLMLTPCTSKEEHMSVKRSSFLWSSKM